MPIKRLLLVTSVVLLCSATAAHASTAVQYGLQDDAWLAAGPGPNTLPWSTCGKIPVENRMGNRW